MNNMVEFYQRIWWLNKSESLTTPLGASNLNKMDSGLKTLDERTVELSSEVVTLDVSKADKTLLNNMIVDWAVNNTTGVVTLTKYDGSVININTSLNQLSVNFEYDTSTQQIIITQSDGTKKYIDISSMIGVNEFDSTTTIDLVVSADGHVSANIKAGSITKELLASEVLADIVTSENNAKGYMQLAQTYAENSATDAKLSQSYAVGSTGVRSEEDTDNARYYSEQSKASADNSKTSADASKVSEANAESFAASAKTSEDNAKQSELNAKISEDNAKQSEINADISKSAASLSETNAKISEINAGKSEVNSYNNYLLSASYTRGKTGQREGEDNDNALYYSKEAKKQAELAKSYAKITSPEFLIQNNRLYMKTGVGVDFKVINNRLYWRVA